VLGAVNLAEIVGHYAKLGAARLDIEAMLPPLPIRVVPVDAARGQKRAARTASCLRSVTLTTWSL